MLAADGIRGLFALIGQVKYRVFQGLPGNEFAVHQLAVADQPLVDVLVVPDRVAGGGFQDVPVRFPGFLKAFLQIGLGKVGFIEADKPWPDGQQKVPDQAGAIAEVIPFGQVLFYRASKIVVPVGIFGVIQMDRDDPLVSAAFCQVGGGDWVQQGTVLREAVLEEVFLFQRGQDEHVIVEIDELFTEALDAMEVQLDRDRAEGRQVLLGNVVFMTDNLQFFIAPVQPGRRLLVADEEDFPDPGGIFFNAPEPVFQDAPVPVALGPGVGFLRAQALGLPALPVRVAAVHPGDDKVNVVHVHCLCFLVGFGGHY